MRGPIFIAGMMQSGTSLLRKLLGSHPALFAGLETHWFSNEFQSQWRDPEARRMRWTREFFEVDYASWEALVDQSVDATDFLGHLMMWCAQREGKRRWVEKTPDNILYARQIWARWPDSPLLYSVRDPRDCYASWKINKQLPIEAFLEKWKAHRDALQKLDTRDAAKVLEVRYEAVVRKPHDEMARVCDFIGEKFFPAMATYRGDASDHKKVLKIAGIHSTTAESLSRPIFDSSIGRFERDLTSEEVDRIENWMATQDDQR